MRLLNRPQKKQLTRRPYDETRNGVCALCPAGCGLTVYASSGAPVDLFGNELHPVNKGALCPKALALYKQLYNPARLALPGIRNTAEAPWTLVDWDTAIRFAAQKLADIAPERVLVAGRENDPFDFTCGAEWLADVLKTPLHPSDFSVRAFTGAGALKKMTGVPADQFLGNTPRDWRASKVILVTGGDLAAESPITFGPLQDARDRGKKLLYLGSRGGMTARRSSDAWIVHPGTESLALASVVNALLKSDRLHQTFVSGLEELQKRAAGFTFERVAPLCGLDAGRLEELAQIIIKNDPVQVLMGQLEQRRFIDDATLTLGCAIVALKGCIGRPGGGLNVLGGTPFEWNTSENAPQTVEERLLSGDVLAFIGYGDQFSALAGDAARTAFEKTRLPIHIGCFDNATRQRALVSLPAAHPMEYETLAARADGRAIQWRSQLLKSFGTALPPLSILARLVEALEPSAKAPWAVQTANAPNQRALADWMLSRSPLTAGMRVEDLAGDAWKNAPGGLLWPCPEGSSNADKDYENTRYISGNIRGRNNILSTPYSAWPGSTRRFPTDDGKIHLEETVLPALPEPDAQEEQSGLSLSICGLVDRAVDHPQVPLWPQDALAPPQGLT